MLRFNDTSALVGHFVLSPREREKRDRRDRRGDEKEGQGRKRNRNKSEEQKKKSIPPLTLPLPATRIAGLAQLEANISCTPRCHKIPATFATPNHPLLNGWLLSRDISGINFREEPLFSLTGLYLLCTSHLKLQPLRGCG